MATEKSGRHLLDKIVPLAALTLAVLVPSSPWANAAGDNPFGNAVKIADASLDTVRGGFEMPHHAFLPFGLDVNFSSFVDGMKVTDISLSNGGNQNNAVQFSSKNLNTTVTVGGPPTDPVVNAVSTNVTTSLTSNGIMTVIQNNRPNIVLQTQQVLNVNISGLQNLIRSAVITSHFNGRGFFH